MRTTITIESALLTHAKERAARAGKTLSGLIREALRAELQRKPLRNSKPFRLVTFGGDGVEPRIKLERLGDLVDEQDNLSFLRELNRTGRSVA